MIMSAYTSIIRYSFGFAINELRKFYSAHTPIFFDLFLTTETQIATEAPPLPPQTPPQDWYQFSKELQYILLKALLQPAPELQTKQGQEED